MAASCFFVQNLLSDFVEGILPSARHSEIKAHLNECSKCTNVHKDLTSTLELLHKLPAPEISHEMALRISEASQAKANSLFSARRVSRAVLFVAMPVLLFGGVAALFPGVFPWFSLMRGPSSEAQFARYFPLLQGATEILDEQATWLTSHESLSGSLWEEGGLSPEEFEKTFQIKQPAAEP